MVSSATGSNVTIRGLVQSTSGYEVQASGGATTIATTATGIIRGQVSLTAINDTVNNAGLFDAIGHQPVRRGHRTTFNNSGTVNAQNGASVFRRSRGVQQYGPGRTQEQTWSADTLNVHRRIRRRQRQPARRRCEPPHQSG